MLSIPVNNSPPNSAPSAAEFFSPFMEIVQGLYLFLNLWLGTIIIHGKDP
jgi:hypothetical protein